MPMAQSRIWSRPTAMKCSSGVSIQPYVASSAYHSAITRQSPDCSAARLMSSQESQNSSISALVRLTVPPRWPAPWLGSTGPRHAPAPAATRRGARPGRRPGPSGRRSRRRPAPPPGTSGAPGRARGRRRPSSGPPAVRHAARLLELDDHLGDVVLVLLGRLRHLELVVAQDDREDRLHLHHREGVADATVLAGAERDPGPAVLQVLLARVDVPAGVERVRVREV